MKKTYENINVLLKQIDYAQHKWHICEHLKVIGLLMGIQPGCTKHFCFLCEWDSRARQDLYVVRDWTRHTGLVPGQKNVAYPPLVDPGKIYLPPLHIKLA